ncbi:MAG: hypothetical protein BROFUL_00952 [Candidatus Brocadia fulgida]|uniref:Uncharacterized protein n=1 Tax=Candidatus Brocadia fulgida TaxID=380242 RepID=A0A0M2UXL8_9BACT|nr:MAG: hypothetical protein BROFUL_00952 [Candidatus Brocadia fulgida]
MPEFLPDLNRFPASHLSFRAGTVNAARSCIFEELRRDMLCLTEHFGCQFPYLPLCTVTAAYLKEVQKFAGVHGDDYFGLGGIGQQKAGVLEGAFSLIPECSVSSSYHC